MTWRMVSPRSVRNIQLALLIACGLWGLDYLLPPTEPSAILNLVENRSLLPLSVWGALMVAASIIGLTCELLLNRDYRRWRKAWVGSWTAHAMFATVFAMLAVGSFVSVPLANDGYAGWRTPVLWAVVAGINSAYARRIDGNVRAML